MNKYLFCILFSFTANAAFASYTYEYNVSDISAFNYDTIIVNSGVVIDAASSGDIVVNYAPLYLYNSGTINGRIDTNGNNLFLYNSGTITGGITTQNGGNLVQIVRNPAEITNLGVSGNYVVKLDGFQNADFDSVKDMSAQSFVLTNSSIVINSFTDWQNWNKPVSVEGPACLIINDVASVQSGDIIENISSGVDMLTVQFSDPDNLHSISLRQVGTKLILDVVRTTDYNVVFTTDDAALEQIKNKHPNDKLISALNKANNQSEINRIKEKSYRYNHKILSRPIKIIKDMSSADMIDEETNSGAGLDLGYAFSNTVSSMAGRVGVGANFDNLSFNVGLNFNQFDFSDKYNDFSGISYGLDLKAKQRLSKLWFHEKIGFLLAKYHADYIDANNRLKTNPNGFMWYTDLDAGYDFQINEDLVLAPYLGVNFEQYNVAESSPSDFYLHGGSKLRYSFIMDGLKYEYGASLGVASNGNLFSGVKLGFVSINDMVGASLKGDIYIDKDDCYYKLSINANLMF